MHDCVKTDDHWNRSARKYVPADEVIVRQKMPPPGEVTGLGMKGLQIHLSMMAMRAGYDMIENRCNVCKKNIRIREKVKYIEQRERK